jgi:hypothetical protein
MSASVEAMIGQVKQQILHHCSPMDEPLNACHWLLTTSFARRYAFCELSDHQLQALSGPELLSLISYLQGPCLLPVVRQAWRQCLIENDATGLDILRPLPGLTDCWQWLQDTNQLDEQAATHYLSTCEDQLQRLLLCRRFPHLTQLGWLADSDLPAEPADQALLPLLAPQPACQLELVQLLAARPDLLCSHDPQACFELLIHHAQQDPASLLQPLAFAWDDRTHLCLASWYVQHGDAHQVRVHLDAIQDAAGLQPDLDLVLAIHALESGDAATAVAHWEVLPAGPQHRYLLARLARAGMDTDPNVLAETARACTAVEDETFFLLIQVLLSKRALLPARAVAQEVGERFQQSEAVQRLLQVLLK